jgi:hypothetical protein
MLPTTSLPKSTNNESKMGFNFTVQPYFHQFTQNAFVFGGFVAALGSAFLKNFIAAPPMLMLTPSLQSACRR